jgi:hypothetical protein
VAAELFVKLVEVQGIEASAASISALKSEMLDRVEEAQPNMVCISATPPAAVIHARYLCKKLHARFPRIPIVVALWDAQGDMKKGSDRLTPRRGRARSSATPRRRWKRLPGSASLSSRASRQMSRSRPRWRLDPPGAWQRRRYPRALARRRSDRERAA